VTEAVVPEHSSSAQAAESIEERLAAAGLPGLPRTAWLEIDTDALAGNLRVIRALVPPETSVAAVIKADGYGHGLQVAARTFAAAGADLLCVATLDEALAVRRAGVRTPLLVLFALPAGSAGIAASADIQVVATDLGALDALVRERLPDGGLLRVHLEIETGFQRGGVPVAAAAKAAATIQNAPGIELAGLWSHLASANDAAFSAAQLGRLEAAARAIAQSGMDLPTLHLDASGGVLYGTGAVLELVRPGLSLYGALPETRAADGSVQPFTQRAQEAAQSLRPAMTLKARPLRIADVPAGSPVGYGGLWVAERPSRVATLPVGYGDGYVRAYQPGAEVLVRGLRVPVVGSIAMDAIHVDVTGVPGVAAADEFVLLGAQGSDRITPSDLARRRNTIPWEVLCDMAYRLPRVYDASAGLKGVRTLAGEVLVEEDTR
jgi:alanine racemase